MLIASNGLSDQYIVKTITYILNFSDQLQAQFAKELFYFLCAQLIRGLKVVRKTKRLCGDFVLVLD